MTTDELKAIAHQITHLKTYRHDQVEELAEAYLALLAQDAAHTAESADVTAARLAVNDWHVCSTHDELNRWRAAQARLIIAAKASVAPELEAMRAELDAIKAQDAARGEIVQVCPRCSAHEPTWLPESGCWRCYNCTVHLDAVEHWQRVNTAAPPTDRQDA